MLRQIILNEWRLWRRDSRTRWLLFTLAGLSVLALLLQLLDVKKQLAQRQQAQQASRTAWLQQGAKHPHFAAHFGNYAYKQPSVLSIFDPGLTPYTGTSVYLEPHRQNDFLLSESSERDTGARFGWFTPSFVCQLIVPLLIVLLTFNTVVAEKKDGTYRLSLAQGASPTQILFGKTAAAFGLFAVFLTAYLAVAGTAALVLPTGFPVASFIYLWGIYLLYCAVWCSIGVGVSAVVKSTGASISLLLLFWMVTSILLPRWAASAAENQYPLTTNYAFKKKVAEDIVNGLNGHDAQSERAKRIEDSVLKANGVDSVQQLPFNFEGYIMQQGEEYSSNVYDAHFSSIYQTLQHQQKMQSLFAIASPYLLLRNMSMAAANTSLETEIQFQQDAEAYRRNFVQQLNKDMMQHSAYGDAGWNNYKVKNSLYGAIQDFTAPAKPLRWRLTSVSREQLLLLLWVGLVAGSLFFISHKNFG